MVWIVSIKEIFISKIKTCEIFSERDLTYFRKAHIGFVFQNFNLISHQSVLENVKMPLYVKNMTDKEMAEIAERELSRLGIGDFIKKNVKAAFWWAKTTWWPLPVP